MKLSNGISTAAAKSLRADQIRFLYAIPARILVNAVNAILVAVVLWTDELQPVLISWVAVMCVAAVGRFALSTWFNRNPPADDGIDRAAMLYAVGSFVSGLVWAPRLR